MGIGKSKVSPSIDVDDMLGAVEAERQIASGKEELEKALKELRELKSVLQMFMEDLETAIGAECKAEGALKAAAESCDNVVVGICKAIVDAEQNTVFRAEISPECLAQLRQLLDAGVHIEVLVEGVLRNGLVNLGCGREMRTLAYVVNRVDAP